MTNNPFSEPAPSVLAMVFRIGSYQVFELMGHGSYSKVYRAYNVEKRFDCALKVVDTENYSPEDQMFLEREIEIAQSLNHPNICKVYESFHAGNQVCIAMELLNNGSLLEYINYHGALSVEQLRVFFKQMVSAVQYLHKDCGVIHRDLKCENWMLSSTFQVKLIDFGFARHMSDDQLMSTICGSLHYTAPEIIKGEEYTDLIDVWSLGVVLYAMAKGELPFSSESLEKAILTCEPEYPSSWCSEIVTLVKGMLQKDPSMRWGISDVARFQFLNEPTAAKTVIRQSVSSGSGGKIILPALISKANAEHPRMSELNLHGRRHLIITPMVKRTRAFSVEPLLSPPATQKPYAYTYGGGTLAKSLAVLPDYRPSCSSPVVPL